MTAQPRHSRQVDGSPLLVSLFAGIGGLDLGLCDAVPDLRHLLMCEQDESCRAVLQRRWPTSFIHDDVRTLRGVTVGDLAWLTGGGPVVMAGGFPCQDVSIANPRGRGIDGKRSGLWHEYRRLIEDVRPAVAVIENSPRLRTKGLTTIVEQLDALGYVVDATRIRAENVGAPHRRERLFLVAARHDRPEAVLNDGRWARLTPGPKLHDVPRWSTQAHADPWPTVTVKGNHNKAGLSERSGDGLATAVSKWTTLVKADGDRGPGGRNLRTDVDQWPTLTAQSYGSNQGGAAGRTGKVRKSLRGHAGGPLNPEWCEAFMGFPKGWTDADNTDPTPFPGFPMGRGPNQHEWEPARTVTPRSLPGRRARVKALGNAVLPPVARIVGQRVAAYL